LREQEQPVARSGVNQWEKQAAGSIDEASAEVALFCLKKEGPS
jgi:hypothetical protein